MLADSDKPEMRKLVLGAIKAHPTPANRQILDKLLKDEDAGVREAAEKVANELQQMADSKSNILISSTTDNNTDNDKDSDKENFWFYPACLVRFSTKRTAAKYFPKRFIHGLDFICMCVLC